MARPVKLVVDLSQPPGQQEAYVEMTAQEARQYERDVKASLAAQEADKRATRNALLAASDWSQLPDAQAAMSDRKKKAWLKYRQELRDNPLGPWPEVPR